MVFVRAETFESSSRAVWAIVMSIVSHCAFIAQSLKCYRKRECSRTKTNENVNFRRLN